MKQKVFISRNEDEIASLIHLLRAAGYETEAHSLIQTNSIPFVQPIPKTDWIFFSSGNAVRHFFSQIHKTPRAQFAAIGKGTEKELLKFAQPSFVGDSIDVMETARQFAQVTKKATILFPGAQDSLKNVQSLFDARRVFDLTCYKTDIDTKRIGYPDILLFSSPSNVRSFFTKNRLFSFQQCIAFGASTASALHSMQAMNISIPRSLSDKDLLEAINQVADS